jgi:integrase
VRKLHTALSSALTEAVRWNWIVYNPAHRARLPEIPPSVGTAPPDEDLQRILDVRRQAGPAVPGVDPPRDRDRNRPGEILALQWSRVDLKKATIKVAFGTDIDHTLKATKTNKQSASSRSTQTSSGC